MTHRAVEEEARRKSVSPACRILYVEDPIAGLGGAQRSLIELASAIRERRFDPVVASRPQQEFEQALADAGVRHVALRPGPGGVWRVLSRVRPQIVHCNVATERLTLYGALAARARRIPFVWHVRIAASTGWRDRLLARLSSHVVCISAAVASKFLYVEPSRLSVIYNACDVSRFRPLRRDPELRRRLGWSERAAVVGVVNRIDPGKGIGIFLRAFARVRERHPRAHALVVGGGDEAHLKALKAVARRERIAGSVVFVGHSEDVPRWMSTMDVVVHSPVIPEPFGRVIVEAMACGRPVVAADLGAPSEIITDGWDGYLAPGRDPAGLARWIVRLLDDAELRERMGRRARRTALRRFSLDRLAREVGVLYRRLLRDNGSAVQLR
ncbi:MAG: glycosyltransferase family 4 protein [Nitrospirae bacterium]|nr:glycosyltransferase family 4 protein [Nitrospirota bacterium]